MNIKELMEKNEKEFEEKFVRDDGLMDKYTWDGTSADDVAPRPMASAIKSHLHASQLSIVEWVKWWLENRLGITIEDINKPFQEEYFAKSKLLEDLLHQLNNLQ